MRYINEFTEVIGYLKKKKNHQICQEVSFNNGKYFCYLQT